VIGNGRHCPISVDDGMVSLHSWGVKVHKFIKVIAPKQLGLLGFLVAAVLAFYEHAQAQNDHLIVPWQRIGPIELGMTAADLIRILGEPTQTSRGPPGGISVYSWKNDLSVYIKMDGSYVTQICALDPAYATTNGVHPGATNLSVAALLGQPKSSRVYRGWWKLSYTNLYWPGLMVSIPLAGFEKNNSVRMVCVNHNDAISE
jgi:hypothetical protein